MEENTEVSFLSRDSFASALRKGQGRALLHVMHYGLENVADLVLEACLHNQVYDQQIEALRADWLFWMFGKSAYLPKFKPAILNALATQTDTRNLMQLSWLAREMTELGDAEARHQLKEFVFRIASGAHEDDWLGVYDWLLLEGAQGALDLARVYGQRLLKNPDDSANDGLLKYDDLPGLKDILVEHAEKEVSIKVYLEYIDTRKAQGVPNEPVDREKARQDYHTRVREKYQLAGILEEAKKRAGTSLGRYMIFGRHATDEELKIVYSHLMSETDAGVLTRLLWVFRRAKLPQLNQVFFEWANGTDQEPRAASIAALAQIMDERVHDLARLKVETGSLLGGDSAALDLFLLNYESSDATLIARNLANLHPDPEDAHCLGYSIRELAKRYNDPGLVDTMMWAYENTPCGFCRLQVIEWLHQFSMFTDALRFECQYDAEDDIREFAVTVSKA